MILISTIYVLFDINSVTPLKISEIWNDSSTSEEVLLKINNEYYLEKSVIFRLIKFWERFFSGQLRNFSTLNEKIGVSNQLLTNNFNYWIKINKYSYFVGIISLIISIPLAYTISFIMILKKYSLRDYLLNTIILMFLSVPLIISIPFVNLILSSLGYDFNFNKNNLLTMILPLTNLVLFNCFSLIQILRPVMINISESNSYLFYKQLGFNKLKIFFLLFLPLTIRKFMNALPFYIVSIFLYGIYFETFYSFPGTISYIYGVISNYETDSICYFFTTIILTFIISFLFMDLLINLVTVKDKYAK